MNVLVYCNISVFMRVKIGSLEHLLPVFLALILCILLINLSKSSTLKTQKQIFNVLGVLVSLTVVIFHVYHIFYSDYNIQTDLPLYLCSLLAIVIPLFTFFRKYWMFEILVFWIIAGTLQGTFTPDIAIGYPSFDYFRYWIVHLGLLLIIFYAIFVFKMRPRFKSVFISFLALQLYLSLMIITNVLLDANYFYLNHKPISASLLDYFGDWPYYIIVTQLIIIPLFLLIYLPFHLNKIKKIS